MGLDDMGLKVAHFMPQYHPPHVQRYTTIRNQTKILIYVASVCTNKICRQHVTSVCIIVVIVFPDYLHRHLFYSYNIFIWSSTSIYDYSMPKLTEGLVKWSMIVILTLILSNLRYTPENVKCHNQLHWRIKLSEVFISHVLLLIFHRET